METIRNRSRISVEFKIEKKIPKKSKKVKSKKNYLRKTGKKTNQVPFILVDILESISEKEYSSSNAPCRNVP